MQYDICCFNRQFLIAISLLNCNGKSFIELNSLTKMRNQTTTTNFCDVCKEIIIFCFMEQAFNSDAEKNAMSWWHKLNPFEYENNNFNWNKYVNWSAARKFLVVRGQRMNVATHIVNVAVAWWGLQGIRLHSVCQLFDFCFLICSFGPKWLFRVDWRRINHFRPKSVKRNS